MTHSQIKKIAEYLAFFVLLIFFATPVYAQTYKNDYSRWEKKRHARKSTFYIVLHTTEASNRSSLAIVKRQGTCNYLVTTDGVIHRIISDNKIAKHAGISMWNGHSNLSNCSIGIETVGFHTKKPTKQQIKGISKLLAYLKGAYHLSDDKIVTHSMVAYQPSGGYWRYKERGRKRCGMLLATKEIRQQLGLKTAFCIDPDVVAGRVHNDADPYLASILYCGKRQVCVSTRPPKGVMQKNSDEDDEKFEGFRTLGKLGAKKVAGSEYNSETTIYFLVDGKIRTGADLRAKELNTLPPKTKVLVGYVYGGKISSDRTAYSIVKGDWDDITTFYRFPDGSIKNGDDIEESELVNGTIVLFRQ